MVSFPGTCKNTGEYDKTDSWDETVFALDRYKLSIQAGNLSGVSGMSFEDAFDVVLAAIGTHEGNHSIQDFVDLYFKKKGGTVEDLEALRDILPAKKEEV